MALQKGRVGVGRFQGKAKPLTVQSGRTKER